MDKLNMHTADVADVNITKLSLLFPNCITETINEDGHVVKGINYEQLQQELSKVIVNENEERYQFTWPGKRNSILLANSPTSSCLRPNIDGSVNFETTSNLYIEGDNLEVLKLLRETYLHKVDIIYIDPPYNTGKNLIYKNNYHSTTQDYFKDNFQDDLGNILVKNPSTDGRFHSNWLNMLYPRLKVSKDLLSPEGILVLTIDDYEIETVTMILNEIFGEENRLATIVIKNNPSGRSTSTGASISHEYALFYGGSANVKLGRLDRNEKQIARYKEEDEIGRFEWVNFRKHGGFKEESPSMYYPIYIKKDMSDFRIPKLKWNKENQEYKILEEHNSDEIVSYPIDEQGRERRWKWSLERAISDKKDMRIKLDKDKQPAIYIKARMDDSGMLPLTVWDDKKYSSTEYGTNLLNSLFSGKYFDYPKSIYAVIDCLKIANAKEAKLILDFFSGSATTADAVMRLNALDGKDRHFIMVQIPEKTDLDSEAYKAGYKSICDIGKERIKLSGRKIKSENPEAINLDTGFRNLVLDSSNMNDVYYTPGETEPETLFSENIKEDRTPEDLLFQVMLECNLPLSAKIEQIKISGKTVFNVNEGYLYACFDEDVDETVITEIAQKHPYYFVMRDSSMASDNVMDNFDQIFKAYSKETIRKVL